MLTNAVLLDSGVLVSQVCNSALFKWLGAQCIRFSHESNNSIIDIDLLQSDRITEITFYIRKLENGSCSSRNIPLFLLLQTEVDYVKVVYGAQPTFAQTMEFCKLNRRLVHSPTNSTTQFLPCHFASMYISTSF